MTCIDQHYCFDGSRWSFPDLPYMGTYSEHLVYESVTGWGSFEPILSRIEKIEYAELWRCASKIPHAWFEEDGHGLFDLVETLHRRQFHVRCLITEFRNSEQRPFPKWVELLSRK